MPDDIMAALLDMGEVIRAGAARRSGAWSVRIPPSGHVESLGADSVSIIFGGPPAPNGYPFELGIRHPLWATGPREGWRWGPTPHRPFLAPAAQEDSDKALFEFAKVIDKWGHELGFHGS